MIHITIIYVWLKTFYGVGYHIGHYSFWQFFWLSHCVWYFFVGVYSEENSAIWQYSDRSLNNFGTCLIIIKTNNSYNKHVHILGGWWWQICRSITIWGTRQGMYYVIQSPRYTHYKGKLKQNEIDFMKKKK